MPGSMSGSMPEKRDPQSTSCQVVHAIIIVLVLVLIFLRHLSARYPDDLRRVNYKRLGKETAALSRVKTPSLYSAFSALSYLVDN